MKRDIEYARGLLKQMEACPTPNWMRPATLGMSEEEQKERYHLQLLCDAGLVLERNEGVYRLTNGGHEFIDAISREDHWTEIKQRAAKAPIDAGLTILKTIAVEFVKEKLKNVVGL